MAAKTLRPEHAAALMAATATIVAAVLDAKALAVGDADDIARFTASIARTLREAAT